MKFTKIAAALALMAAGTTAFALTPNAQIAVAAGASASKGNFKAALDQLCTGDFVEFASGSNISTYVCAPTGSFANVATPTAAEYIAAGAQNFAGTAFAEVRLNVSGGSFTAVCLLNTGGWPAAGTTKCPAEDTYVDPTNPTGSRVSYQAGQVKVGGFMDVEPTGFLSTVRAGITTTGTTAASAGFSQTFGLAVSGDLYAALFADQQAAGKLPAAPVAVGAAGCLVTDYNKAECVPVVGKPQMAAIMAANSLNQARTLGVQLLVPSLPVGPLTYARRVDTSGTQAAAQQFFLGNVCNTAPVTVVAEGGSSGQLTVLAASGTGNVRDQLKLAGYSIGVMSGENNQSESWRWVRISGASLGESSKPADAAATITNTASAKEGTYDFWFQSRVFRPTAAPSPAFWNAVTGAMAAIPFGSTKGLFLSTETKFAKSNSCGPVAQ